MMSVVVAGLEDVVVSRQASSVGTWFLEPRVSRGRDTGHRVTVDLLRNAAGKAQENGLCMFASERVSKHGTIYSACDYYSNM